MTTDLDWLRDVNIRIAAAETLGDREFFESLLAPRFVIRRASGIVEGRDEFLERVEPSAQRSTELLSIEILGENRALVSAMVIVGPENEGKRFHNLRLFVREAPMSSWTLLSWANESVG